MTAYAAAGTAGANFDFSGYASASNSFTGSTSSTSWVAGTNYMELTVSITASQAINLAMIGGGNAGGTTIDQRGFLSSLQVVAAIPEPATGGLVLASARARWSPACAAAGDGRIGGNRVEERLPPRPTVGSH